MKRVSASETTPPRINLKRLVGSYFRISHAARALVSAFTPAKAAALKIGIDSPPPGWQTPAPSRWWLHRWGWKVVAGEYVKLIYYWMQY